MVFDYAVAPTFVVWTLIATSALLVPSLTRR
jgi:hypothetical protein